MDNLKTIYHKLDAIENALYKLCALIGAIAMGIAFCAIFLQVLYRYILCNFVNLPFAFTEELARYCLFWIIYLLLPSVMKSGMEAANTFLPSLLKGKAKTVLYLIVRGICTLIAVIAFYCSFATLETYWGFTSPVMALPGFFMYGPVVIGMGMVLMRYAVEFIGFICGEVKPFETIGQGGGE